jgi:hypothetical protein
MQGAGIQIEKALRTFTKEVWPGIVAMVPDIEAERYAVVRRPYKKTLKALLKLSDFAGHKNKADAYICGYYCGLQMAAFKFKTTPPTLKRKLKRSVK